jgi:hypothetical protein
MYYVSSMLCVPCDMVREFSIVEETKISLPSKGLK